VATHIKHLIGKFLNQYKQNTNIKQEITRRVYAVINKKLQPHVKIGKLYKDKVVLYVDCSVVGYEVNLLKEKILEEVNKIHPNIKTVIIKTKSIYE